MSVARSTLRWSARFTGAHSYGLLLSGGLDTRVMLAALDRRHVPLSTFTIGGKGCADEVIGNQLARMAHSNHRFLELEAGARPPAPDDRAHGVADRRHVHQ